MANELDISAGYNLRKEKCIDFFAKNPELIERPIVLTSKGALIGCPPENVFKVLE